MRDLKGVAQSICELVDLADGEIVLGYGHRDSRDIDLLKAVLADKVGGYVSRDRYHRNAVHISGRNACNEIGSTGPARCDNNAAFTRCSCISVGCVGSSLLVSGHIVCYFILVFVESVIDVEHRAAGIAEHGINSVFYEDLREYL